MPIPFIKMHGLGNDFVIIDGRTTTFDPTPDVIRLIADRHRGVGCDQLIVLEPARNKAASLFMAIFNQDGSRAGACGNATRCVASVEMDRHNHSSITIETDAGLLKANAVGDQVAVDMGKALLDWHDIPLSLEANTLALDTGLTGLPLAVGVNMGNPHAVFFMRHVDGLDIAGIGPHIEHHSLFPQRVNVGFAEMLDPRTIRLRVWERGAGITQACGSGACAALVAAVRRELSERKADVVLDGGRLTIEWLDNGHVVMQGPASFSFSGTISDDMLMAAAAPELLAGMLLGAA